MKTPLLQTPEWDQLLQDLGSTTFFEQNANFTYLAELKSTPVGNYLYLPYGPCAEGKSNIKKAYDSLLDLARKQQAVFVRVEPQNKAHLPLLEKFGAKKTKDLDPAETWILDLTGNDEEFLQRMPKRLRRYHRTAGNKGITIRTSKDPADVHYLVDLQGQLAAKKGISTFSEKYLATELKQDFATLYLVERATENSDAEEYKRSAAREAQSASRRVTLEASEISGARTEVLAAGLVFDFDGTRYNLQGAQSAAGARLHATGILTIQLILDAREKGMTEFDFWGIAPDNAPADHPWAGFTQFKKSFAGEAAFYAGTWDIPLQKSKYRLYEALRKANRLKRKITK